MERYCQSCGMPMPTNDLLGTHADGSHTADYCTYCFSKGKFTQECTMDEMIEHCIRFLDEFNKDSETSLTKEEAIANMKALFPQLKRWMTIRQKAEWIIQRCSYVVLSSITEEGYPRPIAIDTMKSEGMSTFWMTTSVSSEKAKHFRNNPKAGVCIVREGDSISLTGHVDIITDEQSKKDTWKEYLINYFPQGINDPDFCLLRFTGEQATLWIDKEFVHCDI